MTHRQEEDGKYAKSDFVFSTYDDDKKTTVHCRYRRYDYSFINKLDLANLLYQDRRYRTDRRYE